jgi:hypothetical protein
MTIILRRAARENMLSGAQPIRRVLRARSLTNDHQSRSTALARRVFVAIVSRTTSFRRISASCVQQSTLNCDRVDLAIRIPFE